MRLMGKEGMDPFLSEGKETLMIVRSGRRAGAEPCYCTVGYNKLVEIARVIVIWGAGIIL